MLSRSQIDELAEEGVFLGNIYEITQAIEAAARQKALEEAAEVCAEISKDYWMGDCQFEAATRCRNAIQKLKDGSK